MPHKRTHVIDIKGHQLGVRFERHIEGDHAIRSGAAEDLGHIGEIEGWAEESAEREAK